MKDPDVTDAADDYRRIEKAILFLERHFPRRPSLAELAGELGLAAPCRNPFKSLLVRAVEVFYALDEAIRLIEEYRRPAAPFVPAHPRAATGAGCTEAPRGALYHRYTVDAEGFVRQANIVPPTAQNLRSIEEDLRQLGPELARLSPERARSLAAWAVRNHDPCISCSTH